MPFRVILAASAAILAASPVAAQSLPPAMLGTWADEIASCEREESDGRVNVEPRWIEFFASGYEVRVWRRSGAAWVGRARMASEGESGMTPASIRLAMRADGRLEIKPSDSGAFVLVRCPRARSVR